MNALNVNLTNTMCLLRHNHFANVIKDTIWITTMNANSVRMSVRCVKVNIIVLNAKKTILYQITFV